jgi:PIN domain nuclease of toxin-antitoxin system
LETVPIREAVFNFEVAKKVETMSLPHNDPADHFIAATALVHRLTLVTMDQFLVDAPWLPTLTR